MEGEEEESESERAFINKPVWVRAAVIAAGPLANLFLAFLIITIVYSATGYNTRVVSQVDVDSAAYNMGIKSGDKIVGYANKHIYDPTEVILFLHITKGEPTQIKIKRDGKTIKTDITPKIERDYHLGFYANNVEGETNIISDFISGSPAEKAGMQQGDKIVSLNDIGVTSIEEIKAVLRENGEAAIDVYFERQGRREILNITPEYSENYSLGIMFSRADGGGLFGTMGSAAGFTFSNIRMVPYSLYWLITGKVSFRDMTGPVGIVSTMNEVAKSSETFMDAFLNILLWTGLISAAIGATNLVPFPALDGSKLLILIIEGVSRKKIPADKEAVIASIGFFILIGLSIFVMANDIMRFIVK